MPKKQPHNPVQAAIKEWLLTAQRPADEENPEAWAEHLLGSAPKRFTIYEPLALLPSGSFTNPVWTRTLEACSAKCRAELWALLLAELSTVAKSALTNLAINEGIPLQKEGDKGTENILRSPTGLRMLHGDFGPAETDAPTPTEKEFDSALWVSTKQNGIYQTWAPRWTMFSRGNIKEKARLLAFKQSPSARKQDSDESTAWAVDLYGGIGYFVFSYATLRMKVLCWELNPWSVEGLRRGAEANKWSVKVVTDAADLERPVEEIISSGERIIVFQEDNQRAEAKILRLQSLGLAQNLLHVNGGFLPTSEPTWEPACRMTRRSTAPQSWLHLHENVGEYDIEERRKEIEQRFKLWDEADGISRDVAVNHVEQVKTFAPGVWHCVFDVSITWPNI